jgi:HrpA-like RNA helicase
VWILYAGCASGGRERFLSHHQGQPGETALVTCEDEYHSSDLYSIPALIQVFSLHPSCGLDTQPEWVLFNEFVLTTRHYIRTVTEIRPEWLLELAANYYDLGLFTDGETKRALQRLSKKQTDKNAKAAASNKRLSKKKKAASRVGSGSVDNLDLTGLAL